MQSLQHCIPYFTYRRTLSSLIFRGVCAEITTTFGPALCSVCQSRFHRCSAASLCWSMQRVHSSRGQTLPAVVKHLSRRLYLGEKNHLSTFPAAGGVSPAFLCGSHPRAQARTLSSLLPMQRSPCPSCHYDAVTGEAQQLNGISAGIEYDSSVISAALVYYAEHVNEDIQSIYMAASAPYLRAAAITIQVPYLSDFTGRILDVIVDNLECPQTCLQQQ